MISKTVAIVGVGAIGNITTKLTSEEQINLILIDRDVVESHNLKNQPLYSKEDIGKPKAIVAAEKLKAKAYPEDLTFENINILDRADLILDCTDNLETRFLINDYCLKNKKPWIYAAGIKTKGTVMNFFPGEVCFRCIFKPVHGLDTCETSGIITEAATNIAFLQVSNALRTLSGEKVEKEMVRIDVKDNSLEKIKVKKQNCIACKGKYEFLEGKKTDKANKDVR